MRLLLFSPIKYKVLWLFIPITDVSTWSFFSMKRTFFGGRNRALDDGIKSGRNSGGSIF